MHLKEYIVKARSTAVYPNRGSAIPYAIFGLIEEAQELREKFLAKDADGAILEMGDVMWYVNATCDEVVLDVEKVYAAAETLRGTHPDEQCLDLATSLLVRAAVIGGVEKKVLRDEGGVPSTDRRSKIEAGLVSVVALMNHLAALMGTTMDEVRRRNIEKLSSRKERGALRGDGDHR